MRDEKGDRGETSKKPYIGENIEMRGHCNECGIFEGGQRLYIAVKYQTPNVSSYLVDGAMRWQVTTLTEVHNSNSGKNSGKKRADDPRQTIEYRVRLTSVTPSTTFPIPSSTSPNP